MSRTSIRDLPRGVIALGFVSLLADVSSEMIHGLLPVFLVTVLGLNALAVGAIEGIAEATASITKVFSGVLSDWLGKRKPLVVVGYGLAALTKPLFPIASSAWSVLLARFLDRIGKGIRGAPRDALIADIAPEPIRGAAYGARQAMDTAGAFIGPALAVLLMSLSHGDFRFVFWCAVLPAFLSIAVLLLGVAEPATQTGNRRNFPLRMDQLRQLGAPFWFAVAILGVLTLARFSEAFLLLRASGAGMAAGLVPFALILMNLVYAACSYPFGRLADRVDRARLLALGIFFLIAADLVLASADNLAWVLGGCALWGLHMAATQGLLSAIIADAAPARLRASAFGLFHLVAGIAQLAASILAGWLWNSYGPPATFLFGAACASMAMLALFLFRPASRVH